MNAWRAIPIRDASRSMAASNATGKSTFTRWTSRAGGRGSRAGTAGRSSFGHGSGSFRGRKLRYIQYTTGDIMGIDERGQPDAGDDDEDRYFRLAQLSRYASLSVRTLQRFINAPDHPLPAFRVGRLVLVRKREYDAWIRARRGDASAPDPDPDDEFRRMARAIRGHPVGK